MQQDNSLRAFNYTVAFLAVLGIAACWAEHWQAKQTLSSPLIPQSFSDLYFKPALLFTVLFLIIALLQALSIYFKKSYLVSAITGLVLLIAAGICYPHVVSWFIT